MTFYDAIKHNVYHKERKSTAVASRQLPNSRYSPAWKGKILPF